MHLSSLLFFHHFNICQMNDFVSNNLILEYKKEYKKVLSTCGQPQFNAMHLYAIYYKLSVVCLDVMWLTNTLPNPQLIFNVF